MNASKAILQRPKTPEQLQQLKRDYMEEIRPFLSLIAGLNYCPRMTIKVDGTVEYERVYAPEAQKILDKCRQFVNEISNRYKRLAGVD